MTLVTAAAHPAAEAFPMLGELELKALAEDIRKNGLIEPLWLWDDPERGTVLLDGRNRRAACKLAGVTPHAKKYDGDDPIGFVVSQNLRRRHLTEGQRAFAALHLKPLYADEAKKAQSHGATAPGKHKGNASGHVARSVAAPRARDKAATAVGTSGRSVARAERVATRAPDLAEKVRTGEMELGRAERVVRDREAEQARVAEARAEAESGPVVAAVDIRDGDFREVLADLENVNAIITDPPYPAEFLPLLGDLAVFADKVLAPDGVLVVLIGQTHLPDVYRLLDGYRPYRWTCCYLTPGNGYASHPRRVQSNWKPLLVYGGGPRVADVVRSVGADADAKNNHKWGQDYGAFHTIVERFTKSGETVVDPFMGSGTTLLAAHALGRHAIGCDVDAESVATARERLL